MLFLNLSLAKVRPPPRRSAIIDAAGTGSRRFLAVGPLIGGTRMALTGAYVAESTPMTNSQNESLARRGLDLVMSGDPPNQERGNQMITTHWSESPRPSSTFGIGSKRNPQWRTQTVDRPAPSRQRH
jgi:hypothetical protein